MARVGTQGPAQMPLAQDDITIMSAYEFSVHTADLRVYIRVTQAGANQAWTSPIYLVA
jgi:hypothetical protein